VEGRATSVSPSLEELWQSADLSLRRALADHDSQGIASAVATFERAADLAGQEGDPNHPAALINLTNALLVQAEECYSDAALDRALGRPGPASPYPEADACDAAAERNRCCP